MPSLFPNSNLSTASQPWGREVEKRLVNLDLTVNSNEINNTARDIQLSNSLSRVNSAVAATQAIINNIYVAGTEEINGAVLQAATLSGSKIITGTIPGTKLTANTITANEIATNYVYAGTITAGQITAGTLTGFTIRTAATGQRAELAGSNITFYNSTSGSPVGSISGNTYNSIYNVIDISGMATVSGQLWALGGLNVSGGAVVAGGSQITGDIQHNGGNLFVNGGYLQNVDTYNRNVQSGRIMYVSSVGTYNSASSSERYKQDIAPYSVDIDKLLLLEPVSFRYKQSVSELGNAADVAHGFIAEQAAEIGLTEFVDFELDEEGNPRPDNFRYIDFTAALLGAVKQLNSRLTALENK